MARTPEILTPPRMPRSPRLMAPAGACDTHFHIYYPESEFRLKTGRRYTPTDATLGHYLDTARILGLTRGVIVNGASNADNEPTLAAIREMKGAFKGVALVQPDVTDVELERLAAGGMTAFRISTHSVGGMRTEHLLPMAERVRDLGWHAQVHLSSADEVMEVLPLLRKLPVPGVLDHAAYLDPGKGPGHPAFEAVCRHLQDSDNAWIKLASFYTMSKPGAPYADLVPVLAGLIAARPDRVLWGSNWPHSSQAHGVPDDADVLDILLEAAPDTETRKMILADNPARLYGFTGA